MCLWAIYIFGILSLQCSCIFLGQQALSTSGSQYDRQLRQSSGDGHFRWHTTTSDDIRPLPVIYGHFRWPCQNSEWSDFRTLPVTYGHFRWHTATSGDIRPLPMTYGHFRWYTATSGGHAKTLSEVTFEHFRWQRVLFRSQKTNLFFSSNRAIFFIFCSSLYWFQHCCICRPSDFTVSEYAGIEPRTVATSALTVRRSNHTARFHAHVENQLSGTYWHTRQQWVGQHPATNGNFLWQTGNFLWRHVNFRWHYDKPGDFMATPMFSRWW